MLGEVSILGKTTKLYFGQLLVSGSSGPLQGGGGCILKGGNFTLRIGGNLRIVNPTLQNNESIHSTKTKYFQLSLFINRTFEVHIFDVGSVDNNVFG